MIKLVASDLDGTLLQNGAQELTPRAIELIRSLMDKGIAFVAASGRQYDNLYRMFGPIADDISYVAENGSLAYCGGEIVSRSTIAPDLAARILTELKTKEHFEILVSHEDVCYIESGNTAFADHIQNVMKNTTIVVDDVTKIEGDILKIAICNMEDGPHVVDKYLKYLQDLFKGEIKVVTSGSIWIDFIAPDTNKRSALEVILEKLDIRPEDCIAFGDQYNDVEMLQLVGASYAMANAAPGISYYSTYVTDSVEDVLEDLIAEL